jgi:hypothetical protein
VTAVPETGTTQRCAPWTWDQGVDPVGSAPEYDTFLIVESPTPWPRDVSEMPALADAAARDPRTRVLAAVPRADDDSGLLRVVHWRRRSLDGAPVPGFAGTDHRVRPTEVPGLLAGLIDEPGTAQPGLVGPAPAELLLCTHGKRDVCCGRSGTLLSIEVAARWGDRVRTWRCSHTGGHRFAPTGLTFPDGRAWAFLDTDVLDGIVDHTADPVDLGPHYRGLCTLPPLAQVVERELFQRFGWGWLEHHITGATVGPATPNGGSGGGPATTRVTVDWDGPTGPGSATGEVAVSRDIPVLVCGEPPENARKTSPELTLRSLTLT